MAFQNLKAQAEGLSTDKLLFFAFATSIVLFLLQFTLTLVSTSRMPAQIPLFYSLPWGEARLAPKYFFWVLPFISLATMTINFPIALIGLSSNRFLKRSLFLGSLLVGILSLIGTVKISGLLL